jgi:hypothetical protein
MDSKIAVIINDPVQFNAGMRAVKTLSEKGFPVCVFILPYDECAVPLSSPPDLSGVDLTAVKCFSCRHLDSVGSSFEHASVETMADMLRDIEVVIPF